MRERRDRVKVDRRPVVASGGVVQRGSGPLRVRARTGGRFVRRGGAGAFRFIVFLAVLGAAYVIVGLYKDKIVEGLPQAYPVLKAIGFEVAEPVGYGIRIESRADRVQDENRRWVVYVRGRITNTLDRRADVPRLEITVTSSNARPLVWTVAPELTSLAPGQQTTFQSRYNTPFALRDMRARVKFVRQ